MTDLKIEKNIPLPRKPGRASKYPEHYELLKNMEVGDSILFPLDNCNQQAHANNRISCFLSYARNQFKYKMSQRKLSGAAARIWRVA